MNSFIGLDRQKNKPHRGFLLIMELRYIQHIIPEIGNLYEVILAFDADP